jgi:N-acetylglucosamine-6-phosphate deacetylase
MDLIRYIVGMGGYVSIGHSDSVFETAQEAVNCGANSFTHLFNAMRGIHHREPGTVGAGLLSRAYGELICDGIHLHPEIVKLVCIMKGIDRVIAITDSMQATGLHDGDYLFAGSRVLVRDGAARQPDGKLAGSTLLLRNCVTNLARFVNIPFERAILTATINPAKAVGLYGVTGSIESGKRADLVVVDDQMNIRYTFCRGKKIYDAFDLRNVIT